MVAFEKIDKLVHKGKYMLFLRGTSAHPVCLDSKKVMDILNNYPDVMKELEYFDLTKDKDIELSLKQYSNYGDVP